MQEGVFASESCVDRRAPPAGRCGTAQRCVCRVLWSPSAPCNCASFHFTASAAVRRNHADCLCSTLNSSTGSTFRGATEFATTGPNVGQGDRPPVPRHTLFDSHTLFGSSVSAVRETMVIFHVEEVVVCFFDLTTCKQLKQLK